MDGDYGPSPTRKQATKAADARSVAEQERHDRQQTDDQIDRQKTTAIVSICLDAVRLPAGKAGRRALAVAGIGDTRDGRSQGKNWGGVYKNIPRETFPRLEFTSALGTCPERCATRRALGWRLERKTLLKLA